MSLYPNYAQPSTSSGYYAQQHQQPQYTSHQQYQYPPPTQPDPYTMTSDAFRHWFMGQLAHVVVNQKNIIHHIAFIAKEHATRMGPTIAQCIEQHIRRANPQVKLPPWYLLDSISKNIGPPYTHLFTPFIVSLFLESYYAVDLSTRSKMEEMLVTWRTGAPGGRELFGPQAQIAIENNVWNGASASTGSSGPTKAQVLTELDVILTQKTRAVEINPYDHVSAGHVDTLNQLRALVQTSSVTGAELKAIATQLRNLARSTASAAPPITAIPPPPPVASYPQSSSNPPYQQASTSTAAYPPQSNYVASSSAPSYSGYSYSSNDMSSAPTTATPAADLSALFSNLVKAGVVSAVPRTTSTPSLSASLAGLSSLLSAPSATGTESVNHDKVVAGKALEAELAYERMILGLDIQLTPSGIQRENTSNVALLYDHLPLQCKQCAVRFPDDSAYGSGLGKKRFEEHLDLHFKQNLRNVAASSSTVGVGALGRGYTRSWFVGRQDWTHDITINPLAATNSAKGKGRANSPSATASKAISDERMAQLQASFVIIPAGEEAQPRKCPICKEMIKSEFKEDDEEWVWRNAVSMRNKVYHATCHAEAVAANVARRRLEISGTGRSRSTTPDPSRPSSLPRSPIAGSGVKSEEQKPPASPPATGSKRKANELEASDSESNSSRDESSATSLSVKREDDSTPPWKKLALQSV